MQRMIKEKAMKDVADLAGLEEFIGDYRHLRELESSMHEKERLAVLCIQQDARLQDRREEADARLKKQKAEWRAHWEKKEAALKKRDDDFTQKWYDSQAKEEADWQASFAEYDEKGAELQKRESEIERKEAELKEKEAQYQAKLDAKYKAKEADVEKRAVAVHAVAMRIHEEHAEWKKNEEKDRQEWYTKYDGFLRAHRCECGSFKVKVPKKRKMPIPVHPLHRGYSEEWQQTYGQASKRKYTTRKYGQY